MKKSIFILFLLSMLLGCDSSSSTKKTKSERETTQELTDLKNSDFDQLFKKVDPQALDFNPFYLLQNDWSVLTAGSNSDYNSMIASWGGFGILYDQPVAYNYLNAKRFTLEKIRERETYTLSYLDSTYQEQKKFLGSQSGRDTDKMKQNTLTPVATPSGNMAYKEAYMIMEVKLEGLTEQNPEHYKNPKLKEFMEEAKQKGTAYHYLVTGVITDVWVRK